VRDDRFDGILSFQTRNCGGNVSDHGIVEIRSKSFFDETCLPTNAANFTLNSLIFASKDDMKQWIEWNFKTSEVEPTHYSIHTHGDEPAGLHLKHWVIEGRNEEDKWIELGER
jgi:hypothetical protein